MAYPSSKIILAVSATNEWDEFKTKTSADGETWWGSNFGPQISVSAPGVHIYTTDISGSDGYANGDYVATFNGTSSATPFVAGVAALVLSEDPGLVPSQVRIRLQDTADDLGPSGFDNEFGYGRLNAFAALQGTPIPPNGGICGSMSIAGPTGRTGALIYLALLSLPLVYLFGWRLRLRWRVRAETAS